MASHHSGNHRTDEQLEAMLFEVADWTVNGRNWKVMCTAPSLRWALDRAADFAASDTAVVALCRMPTDNIVVFEAQATRLRKLRAGREAPLFRETDYRLTT